MNVILPFEKSIPEDCSSTVRRMALAILSVLRSTIGEPICRLSWIVYSSIYLASLRGRIRVNTVFFIRYLSRWKDSSWKRAPGKRESPDSFDNLRITQSSFLFNALDFLEQSDYRNPSCLPILQQCRKCTGMFTNKDKILLAFVPNSILLRTMYFCETRSKSLKIKFEISRSHGFCHCS